MLYCTLKKSIFHEDRPTKPKETIIPLNPIALCLQYYILPFLIYLKQESASESPVEP